MTKVKFTRADGQQWSGMAEPSESVMHVGVRLGVDSIIGECGGELSCGTCHVYVGPAASHNFTSATADEAEMLEVCDDVTEESRLACQLIIPADVDEVEVSIP